MALEVPLAKRHSRLAEFSTLQDRPSSVERAPPKAGLTRMSDEQSKRRTSTASTSTTSTTKKQPSVSRHHMKRMDKKQDKSMARQNSGDGDARAAPTELGNTGNLERTLGKIDTTTVHGERFRSTSDSGPQSVIHAPEDFEQFGTLSLASTRPTPSPARSSSLTVVSVHSFRSTSAASSSTGIPAAQTSQASSATFKDRSLSGSRGHVPPLMNTQTLPAKSDDLEGDTPLATDAQNVEVRQRRLSMSGRDLEVVGSIQSGERHYINQLQGARSLSPFPPGLGQNRSNFRNLDDTLTASWTLCNNLTNLGGISSIQDPSWRHCWKLCQSLYENHMANTPDHIVSLLEMFRDLCQALYEGRQRSDEATDSVVRVLWDLQSHLFNTHDKKFGAAFQERTLDFYVALCHRLIKQQASSPLDTGVLLRACWSLVASFNDLRQVRVGGHPDYEDHLNSAVHACLDLVNVLNKGWTQADSERSTPRVNQMVFAQPHALFLGRSTPPPPLTRPTSAVRSQIVEYDDILASLPPETPTTIFDDNPMDALDEQHTTPNILVLGLKNSPDPSNHRWSSSSMSNYTESSHVTSPTATTNTAAAAKTINRSSDIAAISTLLFKAAMHAGFQPHSSPPSKTHSTKTEATTLQQKNQALVAFARNLPNNAFGSQPWQTGLVEKYRAVVQAWPTLARNLGGGESDYTLIMPRAVDDTAHVARVVQKVVGIEQYAWLGEFFKIIYGKALEGYDDEDDGNGKDEDSVEPTD